MTQPFNPADYYGQMSVPQPAPLVSQAPPAAAPADYYGPPPPAPPPPVGVEGLPPSLQGQLSNAFGPPPSAPASPGAALPEYSGAPILGVAPASASAARAAAMPAPMKADAAAAKVGPTAADNAAMAEFVKQHPGNAANTQTKPAAVNAGAPRGPSAMDKLFSAKLGTYDDQKAGLQEGANAEKAKAELLASGAADIAARRQQDAQIQEMEANEAKQRFESYQAETQKQIDDVRSKTIDPSRAFQDTGAKVNAVIGGLLGGIYMGINKLSSNPFIDQMNRVIDRDIAAQETDLHTAKEGIGDRKNMLADMRGVYKDDALAKAQAKNLYLESAKESLLAEAAKYDSPAIDARTKQGIADLTRAQLDLQLDKLQKEAAARAAAATAAAARIHQDFKDRLEFQKVKNETTTTDANTQKTLSEIGGGRAAGDPVSLVPHDQRPAALKEREEYAKAESGAANIEKLFRAYDHTGAASPRQLAVLSARIATTVKTSAGPGMSSDEDYVRFIEPSLPKVTDSAATLAVKQRTIVDSLRSSVATPTLDTHAPGWRPKPLQEFNLDGTPR